MIIFSFGTKITQPTLTLSSPLPLFLLALSLLHPLFKPPPPYTTTIIHFQVFSQVSLVRHLHLMILNSITQVLFQLHTLTSMKNIWVIALSKGPPSSKAWIFIPTANLARLTQFLSKARFKGEFIPLIFIFSNIFGGEHKFNYYKCCFIQVYMY